MPSASPVFSLTKSCRTPSPPRPSWRHVSSQSSPPSLSQRRSPWRQMARISSPPSLLLMRSPYCRWWTWTRSFWFSSQYFHFSTNLTLLPIVFSNRNLNPPVSLYCPCFPCSSPALPCHHPLPTTALPTLGYCLLQTRCSGHAAPLGRVTIVTLAGQQWRAAPLCWEEESNSNQELSWPYQSMNCECEPSSDNTFLRQQSTTYQTKPNLTYHTQPYLTNQGECGGAEGRG